MEKAENYRNRGLFSRIIHGYNVSIDETFAIVASAGASATKIAIPIIAALFAADAARGPIGAVKERIMPSAHAQDTVKAPIDTSCTGPLCGAAFNSWCQMEEELCRARYPRRAQALKNDFVNKSVIEGTEWPKNPSLSRANLKRTFLNLGESGIKSEDVECPIGTSPKGCEEKLASNRGTSS